MIDRTAVLLPVTGAVIVGHDAKDRGQLADRKSQAQMTWISSARSGTVKF